MSHSMLATPRSYQVRGTPSKRHRRFWFCVRRNAAVTKKATYGDYDCQLMGWMAP
jgi:hypothetical protein